MFSLAAVTWSASSSEICSRAGAICLQGPHHSAQKSTSTGWDDARTSVWKDSSVTLTVLIRNLLWRGLLRQRRSRTSRSAHVGGRRPCINRYGGGRQGSGATGFLVPAS